MPGVRAITSRERVLLELARRDKNDTLETFQAITEAAALVLDVARVSIWELCDDQDEVEGPADIRLVCRDLYLLEEQRHASHVPIHARDFPAYVAAIHERRTIAADDARRDPRTREFRDFYLEPIGISSMMDVPIWHHGEIYGVLCFEHVGPIRRWQASDESFAINMADIASLSLEAAEVSALRRRWEAVVESMEEGVLVFDDRGTVIQLNRAASRDFGVPMAGSTVADRLEMTEYVDATDRPIPKEDWPFMRSMRGEIIRGEICGFIVTETGERRYLRLTCSPVVEGGVLRYVVAVGVDVTEEVYFERLKRELLAGLAHELKTPLAIAKGHAQQLRSCCAPSSARSLDAITHACDRMDHLGDMLLDLSSMILGRLRLTHEQIDFAELARSVVRRVAKENQDRDFRLSPRAESSPPAMVDVDSTRIAHALREVLENAIAYSSAAKTAVEIDLDESGDEVVLSVRDHGVGIPARAQASVFRMFYKAHAGTSHDRGGLGVGLYLAREVFRRHGGDMWFESVEGEGSTFFMRLPVVRSP